MRGKAGSSWSSPTDPSSDRLPLPMRFLRHLLLLLRELLAFARQERVYWMVPLVLVLLAIAALVVTSQAATPFLYALF